MQQYDAKSLVVHSQTDLMADVIVEVTPQLAGWESITFQVRRMAAGQKWASETGSNEAAVVVLGGSLDIASDKGNWEEVGGRKDVFSGLPSALYLPRLTAFTLTALTDCEYALAKTAASKDFPARLIRPQDVNVEIRGGDHATRQINDIIPPGFPCERLVVVEVYTPGGNWSSYPPHKHDNRRVSSDGALLEADLDEIYYYKINRPEGYAIQRVYTDETSPLQKAGKGYDVALILKNNDVALVPEGYHPVSSPPGYTTYYLNILAGSDQVLNSFDDPNFSWVKDSYKSLDPRLPIYPIDHVK